MLTARTLLSPFDWSVQRADDSITLDHDSRHRRRILLTTDGGTSFLLNLPRAAVMRHDDALPLDDGRLIRVIAAQEPLMRAESGPGISLARLAWHIGNRHLPAMIGEDHLLLRQDHVIADMLHGLGARVSHVMASFTPEQGAYSGHGGHGHDGHGQDHGHHHAHDDSHHHQHEHEHEHGHGHGHHHAD